MLQAIHIRKQFQRSGEVLRDVSFTLGDGEFLSVIGPSGAGKTTLFRILNGTELCSGGEVLYSGTHFEAARGREKRALQQGIGTIYQDFCLVENLSAIQNVLNACLPDMSLAASLLGAFGRERSEQAAAILREVGLADKLEEPVKNLSGGQKQRVAIARALMRNPSILLAFVLLFLGAAWFTGCDLSQMWSRRDHLTDIAAKMFPPDWGFLEKVLPLLWATIQMSITGTFLGAVLSIPAAMACAAALPGPGPVKKAVRFCIQVLRSFPALILALLATFFLGIGSFAGTAAITVYTFAIMTRLTYEDIESAPQGPYLALRAMGAASAQAFFRSTLPEILPAYLTNALYLLEGNVRHSAILGYVGAGGIGLLLNEKVSWREYDKVGTILLLLFAVVYLMEHLSTWLTRLVQQERTLGRQGRRLLAGAAAALVLFCTVTLPPPDLSRTSMQMVKTLSTGLLHPNWELFFRLDSSGLAYLLLETVAIALVGTCVGAVFSVPLAFLGSSRFFPAPAAWLFRTLVTAIRSVPFLIYGLIFIRVCGPGSFTGVLTLAVCSVGLLCKRFTEAIDTLDFRAYHALEAMGTPKLSCVRHAALPQLVPQFFSAWLYRFDVNIREASALGLAGAGGIGAPLILALNQYAWHDVSTLALGMIALSWLVDLVSAFCRRRAA